ncbi:MAG: peptidoglycan DD-metalloendopeptidase family protein [Legionella sp.]|nr:peptidoglycan DD-metalloendopeptidase family protein [Legionella sp.]
MLWVTNTRHASFLSPATLEQPLILPQQTSHENPDDASWQTITTKSGDSLATLFTDMGLSAKTLHMILDNNPHAKTLSQIKPNQLVQFLIHDTELEQLILPLSKTESLVIKRLENSFETQIKTHETYIKPETVTGTIHHSLYTTAKDSHISYALMQQMADILSWQINFSRDLREGDAFSIRYEVHYIDNKRIRTGDILSVSYTNRGKQYQAIRHQTKTGKTDYFTPEGKSVRKAFSRYPVQFSHISSNFNLSRMHPILKKRRPHRGIDLAAPIGTPIHATSDGRVTSIGYESGYGNKIKLQHAGPYESLYAHLLKFKKGLKRGDTVQRGDVIGYVGQTGLADGPHCHYEFRVNHVARNPATATLPDASPIPASELAVFKLHASTELAELNRLEKPSNRIT